MIDLIVLPQQQEFKGQARHAAPVLPGVRRAVRVPRWVPEGSVHADARW